MIETRRKVWIGLVVFLAVATAPAHAQLFGKRTPPGPPVPPQQRVTELLKILKEDGDENKRFDAVEELRGMDATAHPEIIPALMEAMLNDKKPSVRSEAAYTVGRLRPVQQGIGTALEYLRDNDTSMRVRLQARGTLVGYYLAGYRSVKVEDPKQQSLNPTPGGKEPPLATDGTSTPSVGRLPSPVAPPVVNSSNRLTPKPTAAPPLATPPVTNPPGANIPVTPLPGVSPTPGSSGFQPLPPGPAAAPGAIPVIPQSGGPSLGPPD